MSENKPELWELAYSKVISLSINFIDIGGSVNAGIVLSNLWYWKDKGHDPDGWIYKTQNDWYDETRLTVREMSTARKLLRDRGLIEEKKSGIPAKLYYRINKENLKKMTESLYPQNVSQNRQNRKTRNAKTAEQETLKPQNSDRGNVGTVIADLSELSYITTNTTTKTNNKESETPCEQTNAVSFFSDLEPDSEPPTENPPLLVKPEIKAEDQPTSENQVSEKDQNLSVASGKQDPPLPPPHRDECETGTAKDSRFNKNIPFPGDINNSCYSQELTRRHFALPEEIAKGVKDTFKYKFGRHLLCMLNAEGIDPIARLSDFLDFYFKQNLNGIGQYKDHNFSHEMLQTKTAQAIASKIEEQKTGVLTQTIEDFKKRIAGPVSTWKPDTTPVFNPEELPPETKEKWESVKAMLAQKAKGVQKTNPIKRLKATSVPQEDISAMLAGSIAKNAILDPNPETSSESLPSNSVEKILTATS